MNQSDIIVTMKTWEQVGWKDDGGFLGVCDGDYESVAQAILEISKGEKQFAIRKDKITEVIEIIDSYARAIEASGQKFLKTDYEPFAKEIVALFENEKQFAKGFKAGQDSAKRRNASGCCCTFSDDDTRIVKLCGAHEDYYENLARLKQPAK